jgi:hypothetical protein
MLPFCLGLRFIFNIPEADFHVHQPTLVDHGPKVLIGLAQVVVIVLSAWGKRIHIFGEKVNSKASVLTLQSEVQRSSLKHILGL